MANLTIQYGILCPFSNFPHHFAVFLRPNFFFMVSPIISHMTARYFERHQNLMVKIEYLLRAAPCRKVIGCPEKFAEKSNKKRKLKKILFGRDAFKIETVNSRYVYYITRFRFRISLENIKFEFNRSFHAPVTKHLLCPFYACAIIKCDNKFEFNG